MQNLHFASIYTCESQKSERSPKAVRTMEGKPYKTSNKQKQKGKAQLKEKLWCCSLLGASIMPLFIPLNILLPQPFQAESGSRAWGVAPSQLLPFSQMNSGSGPNQGRKGNFDRRLGENVQHASLMQPGLPKHLLQTELPKTPWWQEALAWM